eukprot:g9023.t1
MEIKMATCHAQLLLQRLPSFVQNIAEFKWHEASVAILPDFQRERTQDELRDPWIAVVSPLLLFTHCEKLLGLCRFEDDLDAKLVQVGVDLLKVAGGFIGEHEDKPQDDRMTDARLETPQQAACHSRNCGGTSSLESVLDFLRQLGVVVEVRQSLLSLWRRVLFVTHRVSDSSLIEQVKATRRSKSALDHVSILPLATSLEREINVVEQALNVVYFPESRATPRDFVSIMELRNAILGWEHGHRGQEEFVICNTMKAILTDIVEKDARSSNESKGAYSEGYKGAERDAPFVFAFSEGALSHEAGARGVNGLDGHAAGFTFSIGLQASFRYTLYNSRHRATAAQQQQYAQQQQAQQHY